MLYIPITAYKPSPNLSCSSLIRYLTLGRVSHLQTLHITNVSSKEESRHFRHFTNSSLLINTNLDFDLTMSCSDQNREITQHCQHAYDLWTESQCTRKSLSRLRTCIAAPRLLKFNPGSEHLNYGNTLN